MRVSSSKQVPLLPLMAKLGHQPLVRAAGGNYYFLSPFRDEKTPSFVVCEPKNVWADFGEAPEPGQKVYGGDVLKLIMRLTGLELPLARQVLDSWAGDLAEFADVAAEAAAAAAVPVAGQTISSGSVTFTDVRVEPLSWKVLVEYLTGRGIDWNLVQRSQRTTAHLQQVFYQVQGKLRQKPYFGLAWKTAGGWEVRSKNFQGCIGQKGLTWLPGRGKEVAVFEGFMDYLSALTYYNRPSFESTVLILNSVTLLGSALPQLQDFKRVHWMGDNDAAGERALHLLRQLLKPGHLTTHNEVYRGYKDFNDFLTGTLPAKPLPQHRAEASALSQTARYWLWVVFKERQFGTPESANKKRKCTFYSYTNDDEGLEQLRVLRNQLGDQLHYYRLCERTTGRKFNVLEWAGEAQAIPQLDA